MNIFSAGELGKFSRVFFVNGFGGSYRFGGDNNVVEHFQDCGLAREILFMSNFVIREN